MPPATQLTVVVARWSLLAGCWSWVVSGYLWLVRFARRSKVSVDHILLHFFCSIISYWDNCHGQIHSFSSHIPLELNEYNSSQQLPLYSFNLPVHWFSLIYTWRLDIPLMCIEASRNFLDLQMLGCFSLMFIDFIDLHVLCWFSIGARWFSLMCVDRIDFSLIIDFHWCA